jgi:hypothetical protein
MPGRLGLRADSCSPLMVAGMLCVADQSIYLLMTKLPVARVCLELLGFDRLYTFCTCLPAGRQAGCSGNPYVAEVGHP